MSRFSEKNSVNSATGPIVWVLTLLFLAGISIGQANTQNKTQVPKWLMEHMTFLTQGSGYFVSSNEEYLSKDEPFDQYAMYWKWGANKKSIEGRMSSLKDGKEINSQMKVRVFWDASRRKGVVYQTTSDGTFGVGEILNFKASGKVERLVDVEFYTRDGRSFRILHKVIEKKEEYVGTAFFLVDGSWSRHRTYTWRRASTGKN